MPIRWTHESVKIEALKYTTRTAFSNGRETAYQYALRNGIIDDVCSHMETIRLECTEERIATMAAKYNKRFDFKKDHPFLYRKAIELGIWKKISSHMGTLNRPYSIEELKNEALKYNNKTAFDDGSNKHYRSAVRRGLLDQICSHMEVLWEPKWNVDTVTKEANQCKTRAEFIRKSPSAYAAARRLGIDKKIGKHFPLSINTSMDENNVMEFVRGIYPKAQKLIDRKVKIEGKPHIYEFHIDIYVPELRKGIEFDGTYWHSVRGLRRTRDNWPEEDLANYHDIKDSYFESKGIKVLHIPEAEWIKNQESCKQKIIEFLK